MQERVFLPNKQINDDLLKGSFETPWWYLAWMGLFAALTAWGIFAFGYAINKGWQETEVGSNEANMDAAAISLMTYSSIKLKGG